MEYKVYKTLELDKGDTIGIHIRSGHGRLQYQFEKCVFTFHELLKETNPTKYYLEGINHLNLCKTRIRLLYIDKIVVLKRADSSKELISIECVGPDAPEPEQSCENEQCCETDNSISCETEGAFDPSIYYEVQIRDPHDQWVTVEVTNNRHLDFGFNSVDES